MKNLKEKVKFILISIVSICIGIFIGQIDKEALAQKVAWIGPSQAPPQGNVGAPVNIGTDGQSKAGPLVTGYNNSTAGSVAGLINTKLIGTDSYWFAWQKIFDAGISSPVGVYGYIDGSNSSSNDGMGVLGSSWYDYGVVGKSYYKTGVQGQGGIYGVEAKINLYNGSIYSRMATNDGIKPASILEGRHDAGGRYYAVSLGKTNALIDASTDNPSTEGLKITTPGKAGTITARAGGLKIDTPSGTGMEVSGTGSTALYAINTNYNGRSRTNFAADFDGSVRIGGSRYYRYVGYTGAKEAGDLILEDGDIDAKKNGWGDRETGAAISGAGSYDCPNGHYMTGIRVDASGSVKSYSCAGL